MKYFGIILIIYILGVISNLYLGFLFTIILGIILTAINQFFNKKTLISCLIFLFIILSSVNVKYNLKSELSEYINEELEIILEVISIRNISEKYISYDVRGLYIGDRCINEKSILYVYKNNKLAVNNHNEYDNYGNSIICAKVKIRDIIGNKNRGLYNYKEAMRNDGIFVSMTLKEDIKTLKENVSKPRKLAIFLKNYASEFFYNSMNDENADVMMSIIFGDKSYLEDSFYQDIQKSGISHIFAVSGFHVGIIYFAIRKTFMLLKVRRSFSIIISWIILWFYGFIIGFPVSILRSLVMFTFILGAELFFRKYTSLNSIIISAIILLIINPFYIFNAGFLLSYTAVTAVVLYHAKIKYILNIKNKMLDSIAMYFMIQLFLFPILAYYFNYFSFIGIVFNIFMIPIFSLIIVLGFLVLLIAIIFSKNIIILTDIMDIVLTTMNFIIKNSNNNFSGAQISSFPIKYAIYYYLFLGLIIYLVYNNKFPKLIKNGLFAIISIFFIADAIIIPFRFINQLNINISDVGQGIFITMRYKNYCFVFDAGSTNKNAGKYVVQPYLKKNNIKNIDAIFLSHYHLDHYNAIDEIMEVCKVNNIFSGHKNKKFEEEYKCTIKSITQGHIVKTDDNLAIEVLWPNKFYNSSNENNMSNVCLISFEGRKILITGDIEQEIESMIIDKLTPVDSIIVPHHGSKTSSTREFIAKSMPKAAIFSYGENNYGIPSKNVIKRYLANNSKILSTYKNGNINIIVIDGEIYYNTYDGQNFGSDFRITRYCLLIRVLAFILNLVIIFNFSDIKNRGKL